MPRKFRSSSSTVAEIENRDGDRASSPPRSGLRWSVVLWGLAGLLFLLPTVTLPDQGPWLGIKAFVLEIVGIILALYVFSRGEWTWPRVRGLLLAPSNLAIFAFVLWIGISAARSELPQYSRYEAMRYFGGALIYFTVVYGLSLRRQLPTFVNGLCVAALLGAIMAIAANQQENNLNLSGAFHNRQMLAAFLCVLFPVVLVASQINETLISKMGAQFVAVVAAAGILVAQNRSSWFGLSVALLVLLLLYVPFLFFRQQRRIQMHHILIPLLMVGLAVGLFFTQTKAAGILSQRAQTLQLLEQDSSYLWRKGMWDKARRMVRDRPIFGWGIGCFPIQQALYYHPDVVPPRTQQEIATTGPTLGENAHNTYWQLTAELGYPGLALYLLVYLTIFATGVNYLRRAKPGYRSVILIGTLAGIAAQMTTSVGNPAWEFPECSVLLWVLLGLAAATSGVGERGHNRYESETSVRRRRRRTSDLNAKALDTTGIN